MNGNNNDDNYRYKMESIKITIGGKGNGIYTIFNNIDKICESINQPENIIMDYFAVITGSNYNNLRKTITGEHNAEILNQYLLEYIKYLVMCPVCNIPETIPKISGTKKNISLFLCCSACKNETLVKITNKRIDKGINIIIKYIKVNNVWDVNKGTMVLQCET